MIAKSGQTRRVYLVDTTLRDGEQAVGAAFDAGTKLSLAWQLASAGVAEIEAGIPAMGDADQAAIRGIVRAGLPSRIVGWCRAREADLNAAARADLSAVHVSLPVSDVQLRAMNKSFDWSLAEADRVIRLARSRFDYVSVGAQDASRAGTDRLLRFARIAAGAGAHRLRLADTVGVWRPRAVAEAVGALAACVGDMELGFHGHNDLGMATANAVSAIEAGATCADVTVLGLGERAGNAPLAEVAMAMEVAAGVSSGVDLRRLAPLARRVARLTGRTISPTAPVIGPGLFRHESGIHVRGLLADPTTYEPYAPSLTNHTQRQIVIGRHTGQAALRWALGEAGIAPDPALLVPLLQRVRDRADRGRTLAPAEVAALYDDLRKAQPCADE